MAYNNQYGKWDTAEWCEDGTVFERRLGSYLMAGGHGLVVNMMRQLESCAFIPYPAPFCLAVPCIAALSLAPMSRSTVGTCNHSNEQD